MDLRNVQKNAKDILNDKNLFILKLTNHDV